MCGGKPKYDWTVLSFDRWGMSGAAPVFWTWGTYGQPNRADAISIEVTGREHHADWFADINHPDARLMAAAPDLLEALETVKRVLQGEQVFDIMLSERGPCLGNVVRDAIEKARGE